MNLIPRPGLLAILPAFVCSIAFAQSTETRFTKFPAETTAALTNFTKVTDLSAIGLHLYKDSLLLVRNGDPEYRHPFAVLNLRTKTFSPYPLPTGGGFMSNGITDGQLWMHDLNANKLFLSPIDGALAGNNGRTRDLPVSGSYYWLQFMNDTAVLASGDYDSPDKLVRLNPVTGKTSQVIRSYDPAKKLSRGQKNEYESFLFLKPTKDKCVLACRYADQVEITDLASLQTSIIHGPENFAPATTFMTMFDGREAAALDNNTRYAFLKGMVTNRYIYLLYSGYNCESDHLFYGQQLFVYDWQGKPVKKISLQDDVSDFAVTQDDAVLYTYHPRSQYIKTASLSQ